MTRKEMHQMGAGNSFQYYNVEWARSIGVNASILLRNLISKDKQLTEVDKHYDNWFYHLRNSITEQTALKEGCIKTAVKVLVLYDIISIKYKGMPKKAYYKINCEKLTETMAEGGISQSGKLTALVRLNNRTSKVKSPLDNSNKSSNNNKVTKVTKGSSSLPYTKEDIFRYKTILKQTLIDIGDFRTNINTDTKTMKRVFKYLYEIEHNLFLPGKTIESPLLQEMDVTRIDRVMTPKQLQLILKKAARNWKSYFADKNIITPEKRPSLDSWFYSPPPNSKQGMSWFLYCATDSLCEQGDVKAKKMLENIKVYLEKFVKDPQKLSEILYNKSEQKKWSEGDYVTFFSTIKQIIAWRAENREKFSEKNEGWGTHFGSIEKTFTTISIFLEDCFPQPNPRFLAVDGWNWNQFVNYIDNSYDINLRS